MTDETWIDNATGSKIVGKDQNGTPCEVSLRQLANGCIAASVVTGPPTGQELVDNTGTYLYEGYAPFGTATSATAWTIIRHTLSAGGISLSEVSDNNPAAEWDERAGTETYS